MADINEMQLVVNKVQSKVTDEGLTKEEALTILGIAQRALYLASSGQAMANLLANAMLMDEQMLSEFRKTDACINLVKRLTHRD